MPDDFFAAAAAARRRRADGGRPVGGFSDRSCDGGGATPFISTSSRAGGGGRRFCEQLEAPSSTEDLQVRSDRRPSAAAVVRDAPRRRGRQSRRLRQSRASASSAPLIRTNAANASPTTVTRSVVGSFPEHVFYKNQCSTTGRARRTGRASRASRRTRLRGGTGRTSSPRTSSSSPSSERSLSPTRLDCRRLRRRRSDSHCRRRRFRRGEDDGSPLSERRRRPSTAESGRRRLRLSTSPPRGSVFWRPSSGPSRPPPSRPWGFALEGGRRGQASWCSTRSRGRHPAAGAVGFADFLTHEHRARRRVRPRQPDFREPPVLHHLFLLQTNTWDCGLRAPRVRRAADGRAPVFVIVPPRAPPLRAKGSPAPPAASVLPALRPRRTGASAAGRGAARRRWRAVAAGFDPSEPTANRAAILTRPPRARAPVRRARRRARAVDLRGRAR